MKYCYRCGAEYTESLCPNCSSDLYTEKPNARTGSNRFNRDLEDLAKEVNKL